MGAALTCGAFLDISLEEGVLAIFSLGLLGQHPLPLFI